MSLSMQSRIIKSWLLFVLSFLIVSCERGYNDVREVRFIVIDHETKDPISGAEVYFTDFKYKTIFDWNMKSEKIGYTPETGEISVVFNNRNDSVRIEKEGYLSLSVVMSSEDEVILVYRKPDSDEVLGRRLLKISELDNVEAFREFSIPSSVEQIRR